jgi:hypothetical protein
VTDCDDRQRLKPLFTLLATTCTKSLGAPISRLSKSKRCTLTIRRRLLGKRLRTNWTPLTAEDATNEAHLSRICLAFVLSALGSAALAAGTQPVTISSTTPTDLGAAPVFVQTLNQPVNICVADNSPTVGTQCNILQPGPPVTFYPADAGSHVWASILGSSSLIAYTPVYSSGSSIGSVTQGTVPWVDDVQQWADTVLGAPSNFGTSPGAVKVPGVNAYVTDFPSTYAVTGTFWQATQPVSIASGQVASGACASRRSSPWPSVRR